MKWYAVTCHPVIIFDVQANSAKEAEEIIFQKHFKKDWHSSKILDVIFEVEEVTRSVDLLLIGIIQAAKEK